MSEALAASRTSALDTFGATRADLYPAGAGPIVR